MLGSFYCLFLLTLKTIEMKILKKIIVVARKIFNGIFALEDTCEHCGRVLDYRNTTVTGYGNYNTCKCKGINYIS